MAASAPISPSPWNECRFLTCSVLPVGSACNLHCPFCFSKSSLSNLHMDRVDWRRLDVLGYYRFARARGATRLVVTGGGEPLLRPDDVVHLIHQGREVFDEIACFTNGSQLTRELAERLADAGLSYLCWSRHAADDVGTRAIMGDDAPALDAFLHAAAPLKIRATCVMTRGSVDSAEKVHAYIDAFRARGVTEFTFKHTYVAYEQSVFRGSGEDNWARAHQIDGDLFEGAGQLVATLPWGPEIRRLKGVQVCFYREPTPDWELRHRICRSSNLLADGRVYASLEDQQSLLYRLSC